MDATTSKKPVTSKTFELRSAEGLKAACDYVATHPRGSENSNWVQELSDFLKWIAGADRQQRASLDFHRRIWENNPVSSVGMGMVPVLEVIEQKAFRDWVADMSFTPLPEDRTTRIATLNSFYSELVDRFKQPERRIPHLKIFRVLAGFFPRDFTTIAHRGSLERLVRRMRGRAGETPITLHAYVRDRLTEVLGPAGSSSVEQAARMALPWDLYALTSVDAGDEEPIAIADGKPGEELLVPLPAARRRKGLTGIGGLFTAVLEILQETKDGMTREEFLDYLRVRYPSLKEQSRRVTINVLRSELGVLKNIDDHYSLTERGVAVLETSSALELGDWLLTRVLGVDHVLKALQAKAMAKDELISLLRAVHAGWTSDFAPAAMISWLVSMQAIRRRKDGLLELDAIGQDWVEKITWKPESLHLAPGEDSELIQGKADRTPLLVLPLMSESVKRVVSSGIFAADLVEQLHLGLWTPSHRHFAVLTGISGSGKTLLAVKYAEALGTTDGEGPKRYYVQSVQPGWYDPSPLLGYLNPLQKDTYQRTECLKFLLRASQDPTRPYVLVLDEMNLSHPEQYLAPLLSAMESGERITLHSEGDGFDGIPEWIPYPSNLAIIGTINMDETTHGLSDKVLDRAFTLEFWEIPLAKYPKWNTSALSKENLARLRAVLEDLMKCLAPARLHFGWRTVDDVLNFLSSTHTQTASMPFNDLLDSVMYAKVLPKLRGDDSPRVRKAFDDAKLVFDNAGLKRCSDRVAALRDELTRTGAARFWR